MITLNTIKNDELFQAYAGIAFIMLFVPISLTRGLFFFLPVIAIISFIILKMILNRKPGVSFLLVALGLTYCSGSMQDAIVFSGNAQLKLFLLFSILFAFFCYYFLQKKRTHFIAPTLLVVLYIIISIFYNNDIIKTLLLIAGTHIAFCIGRYDGIKPNQAIKLFGVCFFFTFFYAVLEFHFRICPYMFLYQTTSTFGLETVRAMGILGNPLLLCSIAMLFLTTLFVDALNNGKLNVFYLIICLYVALIVTSRTSIYTGGILFAIYLLFSKSLISIKKLFVTTFLIGIFFFIVYNYLGDIYFNLLDRFETGNYEHRESAFSTMLNVLKEQPWGLGDKLATKIQSYASYGFKDGMTTLDNFLCTQFSVYGYLGILLVFYYLYYIFKMLFGRKYGKYRKTGFFYLVYFLLIGMSFDLEAYVNMNLPFFILISTYYNQLEKDEKEYKYLQIKTV